MQVDGQESATIPLRQGQFLRESSKNEKPIPWEVMSADSSTANRNLIVSSKRKLSDFDQFAGLSRTSRCVPDQQEVAGIRAAGGHEALAPRLTCRRSASATLWRRLFMIANLWLDLHAPPPLNHANHRSIETRGGTCNPGIGGPANRRRHDFASQRAHRADHASRALSVAIPVSAYMRR